ncbi:MAG: VOC family protein [Pseudomonadota bacterium]
MPEADHAIIGLSPIVMVQDIGRTKAFYADVLGFELLIDNKTASYAMMRRGPAMLAFIQNTSEEARKATSEQTAAQLWVTGIDALWAELAPRLAGRTDCSAKPPHDRDYGVREIHLKDPDGFLIFITQDQD